MVEEGYRDREGDRDREGSRDREGRGVEREVRERQGNSS